MKSQQPYSYRNDPQIPSFDDSHPLVVLDGECVLCSGSVKHLIRWDKRQQFRFATGQSALGQGLLRHYGCDHTTLNTVLVISEGRGFEKSDAYIRIAHILGGLLQGAALIRFVPKRWRDAAYDFKARNRYKWFGQSGYCEMISPADQQRFIAK